MLGLSIIKTSKLREYKAYVQMYGQSQSTVKRKAEEIESLSNQVIHLSGKLEKVMPKRGARGRFEKK